MKKLLLLLMALFIAVPAQTLAAAPSNTVGRVLLQVEQRGEAWYVDPVTESRYYLKNGPVAYEALRTFGLGITNEDLRKIPIGYDSRLDFGLDTDYDGLSDRFEKGVGLSPYRSDSNYDGVSDYNEIMQGNLTKTDSALVDRLEGRILLQVQDRGEAWYVNPVDGKRYYMTDGEAAYSIMRYLSLGIKDTDLLQIPTHNAQYEVFSCDYLDPICFLGHAMAGNNVQLNPSRKTFTYENFLSANYFAYFSKDYTGGYTLNGDWSFDLDLDRLYVWIADFYGFDAEDFLGTESYVDESFTANGWFGCSLSEADVKHFGPLYNEERSAYEAYGWEGLMEYEPSFTYQDELIAEEIFTNNCTYDYDYDYNYVENR